MVGVRDPSISWPETVRDTVVNRDDQAVFFYRFRIIKSALAKSDCAPFVGCCIIHISPRLCASTFFSLDIHFYRKMEPSGKGSGQ